VGTWGQTLSPLHDRGAARRPTRRFRGSFCRAEMRNAGRRRVTAFWTCVPGLFVEGDAPLWCGFSPIEGLDLSVLRSQWGLCRSPSYH
jgi:hypothetical protein